MGQLEISQISCSVGFNNISSSGYNRQINFVTRLASTNNVMAFTVDTNNSGTLLKNYKFKNQSTYTSLSNVSVSAQYKDFVYTLATNEGEIDCYSWRDNRKYRLDVPQHAGEVGSPFNYVAGVFINMRWHVFGATENGKIWHASKYRDSWVKFAEISLTPHSSGLLAAAPLTILHIKKAQDSNGVDPILTGDPLYDNYQKLQNVWNLENYIQGGHNGLGLLPAVSRGTADQWRIVPVDKEWVRIQNREIPINYLQYQNGQLEVGPLSSNEIHALWKFIDAGSGMHRIQSRQNPALYINKDAGFNKISVRPIEPNWSSALWRFVSGGPIKEKKSYLVVQTRLMEDYRHMDSALPKEVTNHRVVITARDEFDSAMYQTFLKLHLHRVDFAPPVTDISIQVMDANGIRDVIIGENKPIELVTNIQGQVSFGVSANNSILAPVFHVHADFMRAEEHGLLVFPDRHALHLLANMDENALNGNWGSTSTRKRTPIFQNMDPQNAVHVTKAVKSIMNTVTDASIFQGSQTIRKPDQMLLADITSSNSHDHENTVVTNKYFDPVSDVTAGFSVSSRDSITRVMVPGRMKNWSLGSGNRGNEVFAYRQDIDLSNILSVDVQSADSLSLALWNAHHKGIPMSSDDIRNHMSRTRNAANVFETIVNAMQIVVHKVEVTLSDTGQKVESVMLFIIHEPGKATSVAIHTLEHAAHLITGILKKVGIHIQTLLHFIRDVFHWEDIKITYQIMDKNLKAVLPFVRQNLQSMHRAFDASIDTYKANVIHSISQLINDTGLVDSQFQKSQDQFRNSHPQSIRSSYVHHLVACNAKNASAANNMGHVAMQTTVYDQIIQMVNLSADDAENLMQELKGLVSKIFNAKAFNYHQVKAELYTILSRLTDRAFSMLETVTNTLFGAMEGLLMEWENHLSHEIHIPYVSKFYEYKMGGKMDVYGLACLASAIPSTILSKIALGSSKPPFHATDIASTGKLFWPYNQEGLGNHTRKVEARPEYPMVADQILGALFNGLMGIFNILDTIEKSAKLVTSGAVILKGITNAFEFLFQLSQIPAFRMYEARFLTERESPHFHSGRMEIAIWTYQFLPFAFKAITFGLKRSRKGTNKIKNIPCNEFFEGMATTIFGVIHLGLFIGLFLKEVDEIRLLTQEQRRKVRADHKLKFVGNTLSCFPEVWNVFYNSLAYLERHDEEPESKALLGMQTVGILIVEKVCIAEWLGFSLIRLYMDHDIHYDCR